MTTSLNRRSPLHGATSSSPLRISQPGRRRSKTCTSGPVGRTSPRRLRSSVSWPDCAPNSGSSHRTSSVGGLVPLDNPLSKANYLPFLDLQRRVAKASGVQLVFLTGIGDLGAVTAFPRIAAMHKRPSATRPGAEPTFRTTSTTPPPARASWSTSFRRCVVSPEPALTGAIAEAVRAYGPRRVPLAVRLSVPTGTADPGTAGV